MQQHPIPQNVTKYQFRLIGPMTIRQFLFLLGGVVLGIVSIKAPFVPWFLQWPIGGIFVATGLGLAFLPIEERPLDVWLMNFIRSIYNPTQYLWEKKPTLPKYFTFKRNNKNVKLPPQIVSRSNNQSLSEYVGTLKMDNQNTINQNQKQRLDNIAQMFADDSISVKTPAQPTSQQPTNASQTTTTHNQNTQPMPNLNNYQQVNPTPNQQTSQLSPNDTNPTTTDVPNKLSPQSLQPVKQISNQNAPRNTFAPRSTQNSQTSVSGFNPRSRTRKAGIDNTQPNANLKMPIQQTTQTRVNPQVQNTHQIQYASTNTNQTQPRQILKQNNYQNTQQPNTKSTQPSLVQKDVINNPVHPNNTISGLLLTQTERQPIINCILELKDQNNQLIRTSKSDIYGKFNIPNPLPSGKYTLYFSHPKYNFNIEHIYLNGDIQQPIISYGVLKEKQQTNPSKEDLLNQLLINKIQPKSKPKPAEVKSVSTDPNDFKDTKPQISTAPPLALGKSLEIKSGGSQPNHANPISKPQQTKTDNQTNKPMFLSDIQMPIQPDTPNTLVGMTITQDERLISNAIIEIKNAKGIPVRTVKSNRLSQFFISIPIKNGEYTIYTEHDKYTFNPINIKITGKVIPPLKILANENYIEDTLSDNIIHNVT